jgi:hypothetical protein
VLVQDFKYYLLTARNSSLRLLVLLSVFAGLVSCGGESKETPPSYVLNEDSFASLLVDFSLAESATSINIKNVKGNKLDSVYAFDPLKEHNISPAQYDSTLRFYTLHPEQYKSVYEKVLSRLSTLESARKGIRIDSVAKK